MSQVKAKVVAVFTEPLLGSTPKNKDVFSKFIAVKVQKRADALSADDAEGEVATVPEVDGGVGYTGFHTDDKGLLLYDYVVKGFFKEAGNTLKNTLKVTNLRSKMDNLLFVFPRRIYLLDSVGQNILQPHGVNERPLRAQTAMGPRVALAKSDFVNAGSKIEFEVRFLEHPDIKHPEQIIEESLGYGALKGLGQWRNGSWGRFEFKINFLT